MNANHKRRWRQKTAGIIRQSRDFFAVPDFRNLGVSLRVLVALLALIFLMPLLTGMTPHYAYLPSVLRLALWMAPASLLLIVLLILINQLLHRMILAPLWFWLISMMVFLATERLFNHYQTFDWTPFFVLGTCIVLLLRYQALLKKAYSPALAEAQLSALTARIRPHFLFNSLNAAIGLIRSRPSDAEMVLENLADLFRAQLRSDNRESTLGREIELAKGYLAIETLRMGEKRMRVTWRLNAPFNAVVPHLLLQPLLENAVYHGISPAANPGRIRVGIVRHGSWIYIRIDNSLPENYESATTSGNRMALQNLSERLFLMYDHDARVTSGRRGKIFRVDMRLPYHPKSLRQKAAINKLSQS